MRQTLARELAMGLGVVAAGALPAGVAMGAHRVRVPVHARSRLVMRPSGKQVVRIRVRTRPLARCALRVPAGHMPPRRRASRHGIVRWRWRPTAAMHGRRVLVVTCSFRHHHGRDATVLVLSRQRTGDASPGFDEAGRTPQTPVGAPLAEAGPPSAATTAAPAAAGADPSAILAPGAVLHAGEERDSPGKQYRLVMQGDGNLVLYTQGRALWSSRTAGHAGARAVMQGDGNLVVYQGPTPLWSSRTAGHPGALLVVQKDANVVIYASQGGRALWATNTGNASLRRGERLRPGYALYSRTRQYRLIMQGDGNLVLYTHGRALWSSHTVDHPGASVVMQGDGNLVVYDKSKPLWASNTAHHAGARFVVQDDSNLVVYQGSTALWSSGLRNPRLAPNERLHQGQAIYSTDGRYRLVMQGDGNLVLYTHGRALWSSHTVDHPGASVVMQGDGNLVIYDKSKPLWASNTAGHPGGRLQLQTDGNLVVYAPRAVWASKTVGGVQAGGSPSTIKDDYPASLLAIPQDSRMDPWGFLNRECVSFVAWRMNRDGGAGSFTNGMRGGKWGNAEHWAANARTLGFRVDHTPSVGAIAQWGANDGVGPWGHVAYVARVHANGTVLIEQYNQHLAGHYSTHDNIVAPRYIHVHG